MRRPCMFWNVQRLFDPAGLPAARALGVTRSDWTPADYRRKVRNLATCLRMMTGGVPPAILALSEVESLRVQRDLRKSLGWRELVSIDEITPDATIDGLDVTMMVDRGIFDISSVRARSIALDNRFSTRDLLEVRLRLKQSRAEVLLVALHWPSRVIAEGGALRLAYSVYLQHLLHSALKFSKAELVSKKGLVKMPTRAGLLRRWNIPCVIMGDFNDEPYDASVRFALSSTRFKEQVLRRTRMTSRALSDADHYLGRKILLYNPCWNLRFSDDESLGGTYYRGEWRSYDQVLFTHGALQEGSRMRYVDDSVVIARSSDPLGRGGRRVEMTTDNGAPRKFERRDPFGASDHFPLLFVMDFGT
jgi:hypothetical protein